MSRRVLTMTVLIVVAALAATTTRAASTSPARVTLSVPHATLRAGQQVKATLVNDASAPLEVGICATLAERVGARWVTVTHTHGADIACPRRDAVLPPKVDPHRRRTLPVTLYDDLKPGTYRVTEPYRPATDSTVEAPLTPASPAAAVTFRVEAFDPGPAPHLAASRILAIALKAAKADGDAHPTLVQHAEGSRFMANLAAGGDLIFAWNWSYLIAIRGSFTNVPSAPSPPGIPMGPGPVRLPYRVVTLVIDARSGEVTDGGLTDQYPRLARLGPVTTDRR